MTIEQDIDNLQKQINELKGTKSPFTTAVTKNPFNKLEQIRLESGTTGSSRFKRLMLDVGWDSNGNETLKGDDHENWIKILHFEMASSGTTTQYSRPVIVPSDCIIQGISSSINWLWSSSSNSGNVELNITVQMFNEDSAAVGPTTILDSTPVTIANPTATNSLELQSIDLTTRPKAHEWIGVKFERIADDGNDTSTGQLSVYAFWLEYLAFF